MQGTIVALLSLHLFFGLPPPIFVTNESNQPTITRAWDKTGSRALLKVNWNWRPSLNEWRIQFNPARRGYLGMTKTKQHKIDIWVRAVHSPEDVAKTIVHELAHAFDYQYLDANSRATWLAVRNLPANTPWWPPCDGCSDYRTGSGDFAECVSFTLQKSGPFRSKLGPPPNKRQQNLIRMWLNELPRAVGK